MRDDRSRSLAWEHHGELRSVLESPILRDIHERRRLELRARFDDLTRCTHGHFLTLHKYISRVPERFYSERVYDEFHSWLCRMDARARRDLQSQLSANAMDLDRALRHIGEIGACEWHDRTETIDDYETIRFIDHQVHPAYLRLVEGVLTPLLRIPAHWSRLARGAGTEGLETWNIIDELTKGHEFDEAVSAYEHTVRNAIAHGGITYLQKEIRYTDRGAEMKLEDAEILRLFDDLLDICNALVLSLSVFVLTHQTDGYELPQELMLDELRVETKAPWWEITGCVPSEFSSRSQLIIYARPRTADLGKVRLSAFQSGALAGLLAPGYDRYFISLRSESSRQGWAAFDGDLLRKLRRRDKASLEDLVGCLSNGLLFYSPRASVPAFLRKCHWFLLAARVGFPLAVADVRRKLRWPAIRVRSAAIHRNAWGSVLSGCVHLGSAGMPVDQDLVRRSCRHIIGAAVSHARKRAPMSQLARYLPLGFARVSVFRKDYRCRRLASFGLEADLVCTIQVQRIRRIRSLDILGATIEERGKYRIAWNRAWLESIAERQ